MSGWGYYLAICLGCEPALPMPFDDGDERDRWADAHQQATGHEVLRSDPREVAR